MQIATTSGNDEPQNFITNKSARKYRKLNAKHRLKIT